MLCSNQILCVVVWCAPVILSFLLPIDIEKKSIIDKLHDFHKTHWIDFKKHKHQLHKRRYGEPKKETVFDLLKRSYMGVNVKEGQFFAH